MQAGKPARPRLGTGPPAGGACLIDDSEGLVARRYDARLGTCYLFRPDQHVCARWRAFDAGTGSFMQAYGSATPEQYFPAFLGLFVVLFFASGIGKGLHPAMKKEAATIEDHLLHALFLRPLGHQLADPLRRFLDSLTAGPAACRTALRSFVRRAMRSPVRIRPKYAPSSRVRCTNSAWRRSYSM